MVPRRRQRVPADQIIHLYVSERGNQTRGVTWFHPVMTGIKMLDGYTEAELVAASVEWKVTPKSGSAFRRGSLWRRCTEKEVSR